MDTANPLQQITEIELVYRNKIKASDRIKVANADAAYDVFMAHWNMDTIELVEEFKVLLLNRNNKVLGLVHIGVGGINCVLVDVRIVMAACLKAAATSFICCHNHPSGNLTPSNHDKEFTKKLQQAGELLDIKLNDHIIITREGYCSIEEQVKTKTLGVKPNTSNTPLEILTNDFNIRGWLLGINRDFAKTKNSNPNNNYFGFDLGYDITALNNTTSGNIGSYSQAQFNGNIGGMVWKTVGDDVIRKYDFDYDNANRLTIANFLQNDATNTWNNSTINYTVNNLTYDANGNIVTMAQHGWKVGGSANTPIDDLHYTYQTNSNKLKNVIDFVNV